MSHWQGYTRYGQIAFFCFLALGLGCKSSDYNDTKNAQTKTETAVKSAAKAPISKTKAPAKVSAKPAAKRGAKPAEKPAAAPKTAVASKTAEPKAPSTPKIEPAPGTFTVRLETTKGNIDIDVTKALAPNGVERFYQLVQSGYYNDVAFFRVIPNFMAQVGLHGDPAKNAEWRTKRIPDDPVKASNTRGMVTFATAGPNTRTTQIFLNFKDNSRLDGMGFAPFGKIRDVSLAVLDSLNGKYGEGAPRGRGPDQGRIQAEGNTYLKRDFPELDYIKKAIILK